MKNIIVFADGEWGKSSAGSQHSNIARMARFTSPFDEDGNTQLVHYLTAQPEAVTQTQLEYDLLGVYRFLVLNYQAGDQIYLFGFSYGAYLMRMLSGFVEVCGLLQRHHLAEAELGLELFWRKQCEHKDNAARLFRSHFAIAEETNIHFMGLYDCVGECGIPTRYLGNFSASSVCSDPVIADCVGAACVALALDEDRRDYDATAWYERDGIVIEQMWFHGNHQQVGGLEYEHDGSGRLGDLSLGWMVEQGIKFGIEFEAGLFAELMPNPFAEIQASSDPISEYLGKECRRLLPNQKLHPSVMERRSKIESSQHGLNEFIETMSWSLELEPLD